jgi:hypothetical protein
VYKHPGLRVPGFRVLCINITGSGFRVLDFGFCAKGHNDRVSIAEVGFEIENEVSRF